MRTALKYALISATFMTFMNAAIPAMAEDSSVLCSVKKNYGSVAAQYTPGVDVNGNAVAPADVNTPPRVVLPTVRIPVTVDMAQRLSAVLPPGTAMESAVSIAEVRGDGRVYINGQDMTGPTTAVCSLIEKQKAAAMRTKERPKAARKNDTPKAPEVAAKPVEPVTQEPIAAPPAATVAPNTPSLEATETPAMPQVLQPAADPVPSPEPVPAAPAPEAAAPAPAPAVVPENLTEPAPTTPAQAPEAAPQEAPAIVAPTEESRTPRPPLDPFAPADGTIEGGAQ